MRPKFILTREEARTVQPHIPREESPNTGVHQLADAVDWMLGLRHKSQIDLSGRPLAVAALAGICMQQGIDDLAEHASQWAAEHAGH